MLLSRPVVFRLLVTLLLAGCGYERKIDGEEIDALC